jgi:hypothetical protein
MADEYMRINNGYDFDVNPGRQEVGDICVYNSDCHPDSSCVNNKCVMSMNLPKVMPYQNNKLSFGRKVSNGKQCLSNTDCDSEYCNANFVCTNKSNLYVNYPTSRCVDNKDCGNKGVCNTHYNCE